jgi:carbon-monoxide dehydrogenase small subunit
MFEEDHAMAGAAALHDIRFEVNGQRYSLRVEARRTLADALRHDLGLRGTHLGCEHGICGACTVLVDGAPMRSCLIFAVQVDGAKLRTVEGLEQNGELHPLQEAFSEFHGLQCGFCTPGFLMLAAGLLESEPDASPTRLKEVVSSNLCRCTGYQGILDAVDAVAANLRSDEHVDEPGR